MSFVQLSTACSTRSSVVEWSINTTRRTAEEKIASSFNFHQLGCSHSIIASKIFEANGNKGKAKFKILVTVLIEYGAFIASTMYKETVAAAYTHV